MRQAGDRDDDHTGVPLPTTLFSITSCAPHAPKHAARKFNFRTNLGKQPLLKAFGALGRRASLEPRTPGAGGRNPGVCASRPLS